MRATIRLWWTGKSGPLVGYGGGGPADAGHGDQHVGRRASSGSAASNLPLSASMAVDLGQPAAVLALEQLWRTCFCRFQRRDAISDPVVRRGEFVEVTRRRRPRRHLPQPQCRGQRGGGRRAYTVPAAAGRGWARLRSRCANPSIAAASTSGGISSRGWIHSNAPWGRNWREVDSWRTL